MRAAGVAGTIEIAFRQQSFRIRPFIVSGAWGGVVPDWAVGTCSLPGGLYFISFFKKIRLDLFYLITNKVSPQLPNEVAAPL